MNQVRLLLGDAIETTKTLPSDSVHCVVTSPPYWGLRDYGVDGQMGLEESFDEWLDKMVVLFNEIRRVLHPSGTLWVNMGDSYNSARTRGSYGDQAKGERGYSDHGYSRPTINMHSKNLIGQPWHLAFALQRSGWILRSDIVWHKPTAMPESVTDRPVRSHEFIHLFSTGARYFFDMDAVRLKGKDVAPERYAAAAAAAAAAAVNDKRKLDGNQYRTGKESICHPQGAALRDVWSIPAEPLSEAHFACVDDQTECLTQEGWLTVEHLRVGDKAAQFDPVTGLASWASIEEIARYEVTTQDMIAVETKHVSFVVTPNHRTIISRRHPNTREYGDWKIVRADAVKGGHAIPVAASWCPDSKFPSRRDVLFAELLGWYVAEGHEKKHPSIYQSTAVNADKVARIEVLLTGLGASYQMYPRRRCYKGRDASMMEFVVKDEIATLLKTIAPGKELPWTILTWHQDLLSALLRGLVEGDGHHREDGKRFSFIQKSKGLCDLVQAVGVRLGFCCVLSQRIDRQWTVYFTRRDRESLRGTNGQNSRVSTVQYTGLVWCPKLPLGTWIARRNGKVFITGNTFPTTLPRLCILAGTSEKGCCPSCLAPWVRVIITEKQKLDNGKRKRADAPGAKVSESSVFRTGEVTVKTPVGWEPSCDCVKGGDIPEPIPCTVLDPFSGAGTTGLVAARLQRSYIGIELNPEYLEMSRRRIADDQPLFNEVIVG